MLVAEGKIWRTLDKRIEFDTISGEDFKHKNAL